MENQNQTAFEEIKEIVSALSWKERISLLLKMITGGVLFYAFIWIMLSL